MGSSLLFPATSVTGVCWSRVQVKVPRFCVRASLDTNVSDMSVNAPKCLFPPEPEHYRGPKLKVAIIGAGLAGMSTAGELLDQGHEVDIYESRSFIGGKVGSFIDKHGNHIEMGLHIFFGCYNNLFRLMKKVKLALFAYGFMFHFDYRFWFCFRPLTRRLCKLKHMLQVSCDVPGIKRLLPSSWREMKFFNNIYELVGVPVVTVQLRYNGWVTELQDLERSRQLRQALGLDDLLYTPHADFSCFADLALTSPEDYYREVSPLLVSFSLFPLSQGLEVIWSFVVKIGQFLYHEGPGKDPFRPDQKTQVKNLFLAGSYTKQDYIDIMEGASLSGRQASAYICNAREELVALRKQLAAFESQEQMEVPTTTNDDLSLV
ncbi:Zeta-carotene desaturase /chromoplastic [Citrus sinensis]|nr:Zeta-carotene desaturase /chromoplastic [Citrus sinensis]